MWILAVALAVAASPRGGLLSAPDDTEPPPAVQEQEQVFGDEANFDQWVFQAGGGPVAGRLRIEAQLKLQIGEIERVCGLSEEQREKLLLAGQGDSKRFFEEVEEVREKFRALKNNANDFNEIWQHIQPLQQKLMRGLYGETSFFAKTLRKTLTSEQAAKHQANTDQRRAYRYRASVETALATLENSVPMRQQQHDALRALLLEKSQPPAVFGQYDYYLVLNQIAGLPANELQSILDDRQWKLLGQQLDRVRGMRQFLIQNGMLPQEGAEAVDVDADDVVEILEVRPH